MECNDDVIKCVNKTIQMLMSVLWTMIDLPFKNGLIGYDCHFENNERQRFVAAQAPRKSKQTSVPTKMLS